MSVQILLVSHLSSVDRRGSTVRLTAVTSLEVTVVGRGVHHEEVAAPSSWRRASGSHSSGDSGLAAMEKPGFRSGDPHPPHQHLDLVERLLEGADDRLVRRGAGHIETGALQDRDRVVRSPGA